MLNGLDLFSGLGGFTCALGPWVLPVAYCEKDQFARAQLLSRQERGEIPCAPIWDDIKTLEGRFLPPVDIIVAGFPCQGISLAGDRKGLDDERSGLFWEVLRLTKECTPTFVFLENVWPGMSKYVDTVTSSLEALGFRCRDGNLAAQDVGANHKRERWFCLGTHADRLKLWKQPGRRSGPSRDGQAVPTDASTYGQMAYAYRRRLEKSRLSEKRQKGLANSFRCRRHRTTISDALGVGCNTLRTQPNQLASIFRWQWWAAEPKVGRVVNGFPDELARYLHVCELHSVGNAVVPLQAHTGFKILMGLT